MFDNNMSYHTSVMEWSECNQNVNSNNSPDGSNNNNNNSNNVTIAQQQQQHGVGGGFAAAPTIKNHSVTHFNNYLYCFGGYDGRRNHMTLLIYSIQQQRWIRPYHMNTTTTSCTSNTANSNSNNTNNTTLGVGLHNNNNFFTNNNNNINNNGGVNNDAMAQNINNHHHPVVAGVGQGAVMMAAASSAGVGNTGGSNNAGSGGGDPSIIVQGVPPPGRNGHSATLATDPDDEENGRIIIIGGWLGTGPLAAADMHVLDITHINMNNIHNQHRTRSNRCSNDNDGNHNADCGNQNIINTNNGIVIDNTVIDGGLVNAGCRQVLNWYQPAVKGTPPGPCNMHSADYVANRKEVYVFRGGNGREYLNDLHALHVQTLSWRIVHCTGTIPQQRANHSSSILDDTNELFIFGGWNGTERLNDIHVLDTETSNWTAPHIAGVLPHPRAGMTLTALRGRLYLFGGSGTSAKCFQDLQILDRHEMAWLDVVSDNEQSHGNSGNNINDLDHRFRFGGNKIYGNNAGSGGYHHQHTLMVDDNSAWMGNNDMNTPQIMDARPQQGGTYSGNDIMMDDWRISRDPHHHARTSASSRGGGGGTGRDGSMLGNYSSPNPNDEDTVPSVLVRGHGPGRRAGHTATAVNRKMYIFGGSCGSDYLNDFFVLDTDPPPSAVVTEANPLLLMERRLRHFFNDPEFADVIFIVGDEGQKVYGHKMVLSIVSDCFRAMFTTGFRESAAMEIEIPDCSYAAFLAVMEYIYTGTLPTRGVFMSTSDAATPSMNNSCNPYDAHHHHQHQQQQQMHAPHMTRIVEILELADRFFLDHLKQICESMLQSAVQSDTVEYLLSVAQKTNSSQLQAICQHYYRNHHPHGHVITSNNNRHPSLRSNN